MIHKCVVTGCPNSSDTIIHYILPEEPNRRSLWLQFIERSKHGGENVPISSRVCGDHFSGDSFTQVDLGFTTQLILNVDAVPTIYPGDHISKDGNEALQVAGGENVEETCNITISGTVSLACVKEEPGEYEVTPAKKLFEESKSASAMQIKQEKNECSLSTETCTQGNDELQFIQREDIKRETGCSDLDIESEDDKERPFSCSYCREKFRNRGVLMQHESNHTKEDKLRKTHHCSHCGKVFALRAFLRAHQKLHVEPTLVHSCTLCSRRFRYKGSLTAHMRHHLTQVTYKCPVCEEAHQLKAVLSQHIRTSHAGSRLQCNICNKGFLRIEAFFKHMDRHMVVTPYYCSTCKVYQLTERGYLCHKRIHEQKQNALMLNTAKGFAFAEDLQDDKGEEGPVELSENSPTQSLSGPVSEPGEAPEDGKGHAHR